MDFTAQLLAHRHRIERGVDELVPAPGTRPTRLHQAMRYSLEAGGKRLRPVLVLAAADLLSAQAGGPEKNADPLPAAVALECLHTYSLVHDDLPCMDNDDLRRGRPTSHRQFDEATALLAGDALLTLAFQLIGHHYASMPEICSALTLELADAAGSEQLIGGQMEDLLAERRADVTPADLEFIHLRKTAAMLSAALVAGGICGRASLSHLATLRAAGRHLGLAFQIMDDILDATADSTTLGKTAGKDARAGKATFVSLHGIDVSRRAARDQTAAALASCRQLPGDTTFLIALVESMAVRAN